MREIDAVDVVVAAAQFDEVVRAMPDSAFAADFDSSANALFDAGLQQLG
ncbi:hypothetical protein ACQPW3_15000 [Actinosynnema sp. CA-248983]